VELLHPYTFGYVAEIEMLLLPVILMLCDKDSMNSLKRRPEKTSRGKRKGNWFWAENDVFAKMEGWEKAGQNQYE
jgi:hypothetical protein